MRYSCSLKLQSRYFVVVGVACIPGQTWPAPALVSSSAILARSDWEDGGLKAEFDLH